MRYPLSRNKSFAERLIHEISARIVSIGTTDPPSYLTPPGIPNSMNSEASIRAGS